MCVGGAGADNAVKEGTGQVKKGWQAGRTRVFGAGRSSGGRVGAEEGGGGGEGGGGQKKEGEGGREKVNTTERCYRPDEEVCGIWPCVGKSSFRLKESLTTPILN